MTRDERLELMLEIKKKDLKMKDIAVEMNISPSLLSQYLNDKCNMSSEKVFKLKQLVSQAKEFVWQKVYID
ncbi:helix-turn-helix transcriptional regulator [Bacillus sp. JJ1532]|uniref:helix-turn-helix domain-containing protein n=1 Tax=Bacillus sp. JJ1532 TaxID=3122958 RepID=UPI002FFF6775